MKTFFSAFLAVVLFANVSLAECDFRTGITPMPNGHYEYTKECHIKVGEIKQDLEIEKERTEKLTQAIKLKDLTIVTANERADLWMNTSFSLEKRVETMEGLYNRNKYLYFGLGVLVTGATLYAVKQLQK